MVVGIGLIVGTELKVSSNPKGFLDGLKGGPKGPQTPVEGYGGGLLPTQGLFQFGQSSLGQFL